METEPGPFHLPGEVHWLQTLSGSLAPEASRPTPEQPSRISPPKKEGIGAQGPEEAIPAQQGFLEEETYEQRLEAQAHKGAWSLPEVVGLQGLEAWGTEDTWGALVFLVPSPSSRSLFMLAFLPPPPPPQASKLLPLRKGVCLGSGDLSPLPSSEPVTWSESCSPYL
jgi:hypothetical protein